MPSLIDIRRRIRSVKNTQQITKAMKMISAARLRRAQDRMYAARPYSAALREVLASIAARVDATQHPLLRTRDEVKNALFVVVTGDRGLCGAFNTNVLRNSQYAIADSGLGTGAVAVLPIGRKANDFFRRRTVPVRRAGIQVADALSLEVARDIAKDMIEAYVSGEVDAVYVVHNEFKSVIAQIVRVTQLLPIERLEPRAEDPTAGTVDYIYEPGPEQILSELLPKYVEFALYRILLESAAAEQGARMTAMESASKNASDMIANLTLTYNRIRQASITKEIIEIVSGAAAAG
ncbi:MAG TPA: ATP synthase F1 subunit gamma [Thermoanaerobaculia bacterium]